MTRYNLSVLWEIPLAVLSFLFYKLMKFVIGNLSIIYLYFNQGKAHQWHVLSAETLKIPLFLPLSMTKGPRWNTHAIIGTLGPFSVKSSMGLDIESADMSAKSWIAVVYSFPYFQTIGSIRSDSSKSEAQWSLLSLKPGKYWIGLRYYNWSEEVRLPAVIVDGVEIVSSQECPTDVNSFYDSLINRENWFYRFLHYYIFTLLQWQKFLPQSLVRREYLPVGAPDTEFFYGALPRKEILQVEVSSAVLSCYDVFLTIYNRSSFPVSWWQQQTETYQTAPMTSNGFYLIRVRPKSFSPAYLRSDFSHQWQTNRKDKITVASIGIEQSQDLRRKKIAETSE